MIRRAAIADVPAMGRIINDAAEFGLMLHRSHAYLYEHVRDFHVAVEDDRVVGVCGVNIVWANLAEIYALAVDPSCRGRGLGRRLVEACMEEARKLGIAKLMSLTYERSFFERLGFEIVDRHTLPHKVWSQCVHCLKHHACDEIAMLCRLEGVPDLGKDEAELRAADDEYEVPVQIRVGRPAPGPHAPMSTAPDES